MTVLVAASPAAAVPTAGCAIQVSDESVKEGDDGTTTLRFVVSAYGCGAWSVEYRTGGPYGTPPASSSSDYMAVAGRTLNWSLADVSKDRVVEVSIVGDLTPEPDELIWLELLNPSGVTVADPVGSSMTMPIPVTPTRRSSPRWTE
ncbi:hypothetical protein [Allorhizocola rhizosphaerae]|uniref:hypothetical protein n=1 Tax=Allorhizocola rhizosphaerae TaxID=1872709 RepID=UPI0013C2E9E9|nr:hypothetical protein [Allorhizocola rhizosphaerae]